MKKLALGVVFGIISSFLIYTDTRTRSVSPGVTQTNFFLLHKGMPKTRIEMILGESGFDVGFNRQSILGFSGKDCSITIFFDKHGLAYDGLLILQSDPTNEIKLSERRK